MWKAIKEKAPQVCFSFKNLIEKYLVTFTFSPDSQHIKEEQRRINGTVTVTATDTGLPVEGISIVARLVNSSMIHFQNVKLTDANGIMDYEFVISDQPSFYKTSRWGELSLNFQTDSQLISPADRFWLANEHGGIQMTYEDPAPLLTFWQIIALIGAAIILGTVAGLAWAGRGKGGGSSGSSGLLLVLYLHCLEG